MGAFLMGLMDVDPVMLAAQAASEAAGTGVQTGMLAGSAATMANPATMGIDEVSIAIRAAVAAHSANFLTEAGLGAAQRALFAAQVGTSGVTYAASNALTAIDLAL